MKISERIAQGVSVALELTNTTLSDAAYKVIVADLSTYPEPQVLGALKRCAREVKSKLTLADILQRLEDGRPGPEEAWSMVPKDEGASVFWTIEMRDAFRVAYSMVAAGELIPARMAFKERYTALVQQARDARHPVQWEFSPGHDRDGRELVLLDAAEKGRISVEGVRGILPYHREDEGVRARLLAIEGKTPEKLPAPNQHAQKLLGDLSAKIAASNKPLFNLGAMTATDVSAMAKRK